MARKVGSKARILNYFLTDPGKVLQSRDIQDASGGAVEWTRRLRELRSAGWRILTNNDRGDQAGRVCPRRSDAAERI